ncbi:hypothetical protein IGI04_036222 [Brassica rapa subsp. trilocularis]|uniref:CCHC-type domain-containing protein n=1 Tax=Brassica rapa subsp. trilocularis TaxID=1813537 RepID=A0ABQ7LDV6_BRACM|nr:hypothetical protein IGI04_036222 [Brassica rapa subsp. trilocularis]
MMSWSRVDLESKGVLWRYGKMNKLEEQMSIHVALETRRHRDTKADLIEREKLLEVFLGRAEAGAENLRLEDMAQKQNELLKEMLEELATVKEKNESLEQEVRKLRKVQQKGLPRFVHGSTSESGAKGACQEVRRDVRQGVRQEVLQRVAVSNKPKVVHQCNNMKVRQEVLKHSCAAGTRKETDRCISNCVRPNKKQHRMSCWFCGKVGHKKGECFAREKSRNMAKKVNKTFTKPRRVEKVSLAKSGLLDEIKDETSEDGCSSVRSDLQEDQEASSVESGHEVVCDKKGKEIERALGADGEGLMVKETTHEGSLVLNRSWSKGSSTGASDRDAYAYLMGEKSMVWCTSRWGEKHIWYGSFQVRNVVATWLLNQKIMLSWSRVDLESKGVSWRYGKMNKLEEQMSIHVALETRVSGTWRIKREKLLEVFLGRAEAGAEVLDGEET